MDTKEMLIAKDALVAKFNAEAGNLSDPKTAYLYQLLADYLNELNTEEIISGFATSTFNK